MKIYSRMLTAVLVILACLCLAMPVFAEDEKVAKIEGGAEYTSIKAALEDVQDGDTVVLLQDTVENVEINGKKITLDLGGFTLTSEGEGTFFSVTDEADVTVKNGTLAGAVGADGKPVQVEYAVYVAGSTFTLDHATISGHSVATSGGGIYADAAVINVQNGAVITGNTANGTTKTTASAVGHGGGGIYACNGSKVTVDASTISKNSAQKSGGGLMMNRSTLTVKNASAITENKANAADNYNGGGGIYAVNRSSVELIGSTISSNVGGKYGGGINLFEHRSLDSEAVVTNLLTITGCKFSGNQLTANGPQGLAIYARLVLPANAGKTISISDSTISDHGTLSKMAGGAVMVQSNSNLVDVSIANTVFTNNSSKMEDNSGSALYVSNCGKLTISGGAFTKNDGGAAPVTVSRDNMTTFTCDGVRFEDNTGNKSGGLYINVAEGEVNIQASTFIGNASLGTGSSVAAGAVLVGRPVTMSGCRISGNTSAAGAGGIHSTSTLTIHNSVVTGNSGHFIGGIYYAGRANGMSLTIDAPDTSKDAALYGNTTIDAAKAGHDLYFYSGVKYDVMAASLMKDGDKNFAGYAFVNGSKVKRDKLEGTAGAGERYTVQFTLDQDVAINISGDACSKNGNKYELLSVAIQEAEGETSCSADHVIKLIAGENGSFVKEILESVTVSKNLEIQLNDRTIKADTGGLAAITVAEGAKLVLSGQGTVDNLNQGKAALVVNGDCEITDAAIIPSIRLGEGKSVAVTAEFGGTEKKQVEVYLADEVIKALNEAKEDKSVVLFRPYEGAAIENLLPYVNVPGINDFVTVKMEQGSIVASCEKVTGVYLDGVNGSDEQDGLTPATAVKTFAQAQKILGNTEGANGIFVLGAVTVSDTQNWDLEGKWLKRYHSYDGNLVCVAEKAELTLADIVVDGSSEFIVANAAMVCVDEGGILNITAGAELCNNKRNNRKDDYEYGGAVFSEGIVNMSGGIVHGNTADNGAGICMFGENAEMNLSDGVIEKNVCNTNVSQSHGASGGGVCLHIGADMKMTGGTVSGNTAQYGGGIAVGAYNDLPDSVLHMTGGTVKGNEAVFQGGGIFVQTNCAANISAGSILNNVAAPKLSGQFAGGGIYVNGNYSDNRTYNYGVLRLTNALIYQNTARNEDEKYGGGGIGGCESSHTLIYNTHGAAIYENTGMDLALRKSPLGQFDDLKPVGYIAEYMLGGGAYNWTDAKNNPVTAADLANLGAFLAIKSNPEKSSITAAEKLGAVIISGNSTSGNGGGIGTNGTVIIGEDRVSVTIPVKKEVKAEESLTPADLTGKFTFTLTAGEGVPMPETTSYTNPDPDKDDGVVTFGEIEFTEPGTYIYTVTESGTAAGVTNDKNAVKTVTVTVGKMQLGNDQNANEQSYKLTATVSCKEDAPLIFTNTYSVEPTTASFPVKKVLEVPEGLTPADLTGKFTFTLTADKGIPMPETTSCTNPDPDKDDGVVTFGEIEYTKPGEYKYTITETGTAAGVTNDKDAAKTVTVTVKDNGDGTLTATADSTTEAPLTFTNKYSVEPTTASFPVKKVLEVPEGLTPADLTGKFTFTLSAEAGIPMPETTSCTNPDKDGGVVTFGEIEFTKPGEYKYTITETGSADGVTNDGESSKTVTVTVVDNGDGTLTATADSTTEAPLTFTNTYSVKSTTASFPVKKVLEVPEGLTCGDITGKFTFTLSAEAGIPMPKITSYANPDKDGGVVTFGEIEYTKPGEYKYTITETGTAAGVTNDSESSKTVTVMVVDNKDGTLTATADSTTEAPLTFTNTYGVEPMTASFPVKKELEVPEGMEGPGSWSYDITVTANDGAPAANKMTDTVSNDADTVTFGPFTYDKPGTYTYTVKESGEVDGVTNDSAAAAGKTVTVTVEDNGDGTLTATASSTTDKPLTFTNKYSASTTTVSFPVKKVLKVPEGMEGPESWSYTIDVAAQNGAPAAKTMTGTVSNSADTVTFGPFTYDKPGEYKYTITETGSVDGVTNDAESSKMVTVTVKDNGDGTLTATASSTDEAPLTFTNTYGVEPATASFPVKKVLTVPVGMEGPENWSYTIDVEAQNGAPEADTMTGAVTKAADVVTFGPFTYDKPGTYTYTVKESGEEDGVTNDSAAATGKTVTVTVVDNKDGTLTATASSTADKPLTFTNTYGVEPTTVAIHVSKVLTGRALNAGEFSFELKNAAGETLQTKANAADGSVVFDAISYAAPGAHAYTIHEVSGDLGGVTYDGGKIEVAVTVIDNGDGTLTATAVYGDKKQFENSYATNDKLVLNGIKNLVGREFQADEVFEVELLQNGTVIQRCMVGAVNGNKAAFSFDPITYTTAEVGTYQYTVREKAGSLKGITYDATQYTVDVTVSDDGKGDLIVDAVYTVNGKEAENIVFTNIYEATGELTLTAEKTVNGAEPAADQVFDFMLSDEKGEIETVQNKLGEIEFAKLSYTLDDLGEHSYTVKESKTDKAGYAIDETVYTVKVTVTDNGDGTLKVEKKIMSNGKPVEGMIFDNKHSATLTISKKVEGCTTEETFPIKVWLFDAKGNELKGEYAYTGDVTGKLTSGEAVELGHDQRITIEKLPVGSRYKVEEIRDPRFTTMVNSLMMNTAEGEIVNGGNMAAFVNRLITTMFKVCKEWQGGEGGSIILTLYANGEKLEDQPAYTQEGDMYYYTGLPMYDEDGDEIIYSAKEKYVDGFLTIYKNVEPYAEETKAIYNGGTIINKAITTIKVQKVWSGLAEGAEVPEITLILHCNGEVYDRKTPDPDKDGWYVYSNLPVFVNGERAVYSVTEEPMEGCSTIYTNNGEEGDCAYNGGTITNIVVPKTGDETPVELWMAGLLLSVAAIVLIGKKRTKA